MPSKPIELPPDIAKAFVKDMRLYFKEASAIKRDEIASRQLHVLQAFQGPRDKKLRVHDVKEMFRGDEGSGMTRINCNRPPPPHCKTRTGYQRSVQLRSC